MIHIRFQETDSGPAQAGLAIPILGYFLVMLIIFAVFGGNNTHHHHRFADGGWKLLVIWLGPYCFAALLWFVWSLSKVIRIERG